MSKLVEGYLRALSAICPHSDGGVFYEITQFQDNEPIQEQVNEYYLAEGWEETELPKLSKVGAEDFPDLLNKFLSGAIPQWQVYPFVVEFVDILNEEYCPFEIFAELEKCDDGCSLVVLLEQREQRVLIDLGWSYD